MVPIKFVVVCVWIGVLVRVGNARGPSESCSVGWKKGSFLVR